MRKKYIGQVIKRLKCSAAKRKEIKVQLFSEMDTALEAGEYEQDILKRMGSPAELAEEFNQSFSEKEKKSYKKEQWVKRIGMIILILLVLAGTVWWMLPKQKWIEDSRIFVREEVLEQAELVIEYLEEDNYEALQKISGEKMIDYVKKEELSELKAVIGEDWGKQKSAGNVYAVEVTQMGVHMAVVQVNVSYERMSVLYTISFDTDMKLAGLWLQ